MSLRQTAANRLNAQRSTGPKTLQGKSCVAQNARRHGLAISVMTDPASSAAVEALARQIAGADNRPDIVHAARRVAEAQIDLSRIRQARHNHLALAQAKAQAQAQAQAQALAEAAAARPHGDPGTEAAALDAADPEPGPGPLLSTALLSTLLAIDRYERRALSRRKFAIRDLDAARSNLSAPQPPVLAETSCPSS